jgi:hypothetical protein
MIPVLYTLINMLWFPPHISVLVVYIYNNIYRRHIFESDLTTLGVLVHYSVIKICDVGKMHLFKFASFVLMKRLADFRAF